MGCSCSWRTGLTYPFACRIGALFFSLTTYRPAFRRGCLHTHGGVQAEAVDAGAQGLCTLYPRSASRPATSTPCRRRATRRRCVSGDRRLQRPQRAGIVSFGVRLGQVGLARVLHQHAPAHEQLHQAAHDRVQHSLAVALTLRRHQARLRPHGGRAPNRRGGVRADAQTGAECDAGRESRRAGAALCGSRPPGQVVCVTAWPCRPAPRRRRRLPGRV